MKKLLFFFLTLITFFTQNLNAQNLNVSVKVAGITATVDWDIIPNATVYNVKITDLKNKKIVFNANFDAPPAVAKLYIGSFEAEVTAYDTNGDIIKDLINNIVQFDIIGIIGDDIVFISTPDVCKKACKEGKIVESETSSISGLPAVDGFPLYTPRGYKSSYLVRIENSIGNVYNFRFNFVRDCKSYKERIIEHCEKMELDYDSGTRTIHFNGFTMNISDNPYSQNSVLSVESFEDFQLSVCKDYIERFEECEIRHEEEEEEAKIKGRIVKNSNNQSAVSIAPNPFSEQFTLNYNNNEDDNNINVVILNMQGQVVQQLTFSEITRGSNLLNINTSELNTGMYFLQIKDKNKNSQIVKITKM